MLKYKLLALGSFPYQLLSLLKHLSGYEEEYQALSHLLQEQHVRKSHF